MRRITLIGTMALTLLGGGLVAAQTAGTTAGDHAAHHPEKATPQKPPTTTKSTQKPGAEKGMMGQGMGNGMMNNCLMGKSGGGMMDGCGMMGMCPGMLGTSAKLEVTKQAKGVTISITSDDARVVARVQKMAEAMRLMHEAGAQ